MQWDISNKLVDYEYALKRMDRRLLAIHSGTKPELVWLLEHPPLYTAGSSAKPHDLIANNDLPVYEVNRGGQYTYHGVGQRVAYVMLNLKKRAGNGNIPDVKMFVKQLENWLINTLARLGITGHIRDGRVGIWVEDVDGKEAKIAALGIRISKGISYHGVSINLSPDLSYFEGIVPCGIKEYGVTSFKKLGIDIKMGEFDIALQQEFEKIF